MVRSRMTSYLVHDAPTVSCSFTSCAFTIATCSGSRIGKGRRRTALTMVKMPTVAPMPVASVISAIAVKPAL